MNLPPVRTLRVALLGLVFLGSSAVAAPPKAVESAEEAALKGKGLRKVGAYYVLPVETDVAKAADEVKALQKALVAAAVRQRVVEFQDVANKNLIAEYSQQRLALRQQKNMAATVQDHNQVVEVSNELGDRIRLLSQEVEDAKAVKKEVAGAVAGRREAFTQKLLDLGSLVEDADKEYATLAEAPEVKAAMAKLGKDPKVVVKLGPSRTYQANVKALQKAQGLIQTESIPLQEDNGTFEVSVTLNGKVTKPMVFDTGAGIISLPAELAAQAGLNPGPNDPTIELTTADGRVHEGKLMTLKSVRVGKFTIENVECAVMPASLKNAPALLGGSFLKYFTYKLAPETSTLTLSKVGAAEVEAVRAPGKKPTKARKKAASSR